MLTSKSGYTNQLSVIQKILIGGGFQIHVREATWFKRLRECCYNLSPPILIPSRIDQFQVEAIVLRGDKLLTRGAEGRFVQVTNWKKQVNRNGDFYDHFLHKDTVIMQSNELYLGYHTFA